MSDAILVVNAGSSSIKFSVFLDRDGERTIEPLLGGQLEGVTTEPRFRARDAAGTLVAEQHWTQPLGHDGAVEHIAGFLREPLSAHRLAAVGQIHQDSPHL